MLGLRSLSTAAAAQGVVDVAIVGGGMTGAALAAALGELQGAEQCVGVMRCRATVQASHQFSHGKLSISLHVVRPPTGRRPGRLRSTLRLYMPPVTAPAASVPHPACPATNPLTKHLSVALLDKQPPVRMPAITNLPPHADIRVSTLTPASVALLRSVGAWRTLAPAAAPFCDMQVSRP